MDVIFDLLGSDLIKYGGMALVALLAWFGNNKYQRIRGANENAAKQERIDNENADNVRDRVRDAKRVSGTEIKYRDS